MTSSFRASAGLYAWALAASIVALFGLIWAYTATKRERFLPQESAAWRAHLQMIGTCNVGRITVLGSSRASAAFVPEILGPDFTNLAMSGGTPVEAYYEAKKIYKCPRPPAVVILSFSPLDWEGSTWFWTRSARFGLLTDDDLNDIARNAAAVNDTVLYHSSFGSEPPPAMKNFLYSIHFPPYDFASLIAARSGRGRRRQNIQIMNETLAARGQHLMSETGSTCRTGINWLLPRHEFNSRPLAIRYFKKLTGFLKSKNVAVLYVATPTNKSEVSHDGSSYLDSYNGLLSQFHQKQANFTIVGSLLPVQNLCDFADVVHLNEVGAETFSRRVTPLISAALEHGAISGSSSKLD